MLKFLQARLQQYMNWELPDVQAGFRKGKATNDQTVHIPQLIEKAREFQKNIYFCFFDYAKTFVWITTNCGKFLKWWKYQTTFSVSWETCGSRSNSSDQTRNNRLVQIWERSTSGCILSPCLLNFYAEYIMGNARLMKHKLESRLPGGISITSAMQMITL